MLDGSNLPREVGDKWRERMGVEPTRDDAGRPATVLKTAETTGPPPLPRTSILPSPRRPFQAGCRPRSGRGHAVATPGGRPHSRRNCRFLVDPHACSDLSCGRAAR